MPQKKPEANLGPNRPKSAIPVMQKMHARARRGLIFFRISSELKFCGDLPKKSLRSDKLMLSILCKTNSPMYFGVPNTNGRGENIKSRGESKDLMSWKFIFYGKGYSPRDD